MDEPKLEAGRELTPDEPCACRRAQERGDADDHERPRDRQRVLAREHGQDERLRPPADEVDEEGFAPPSLGVEHPADEFLQEPGRGRERQRDEKRHGAQRQESGPECAQQQRDGHERGERQL